MPKKQNKKSAEDSINSQLPSYTSSPAMPLRPQSSLWRNSLIILIILLLLLGFKFKNLFIVATVDGKPITRWQLEQELNSKYGAQTLDNLISEQIILNSANQKGITVDPKDVDSKIKEIEGRLSGKISLKDALKAQGLTQDNFRKQVEIQLTIDKMFAKEATISDKEIDDFITQNKATLPQATDPAQLRSQVLTNLRQQKIGDLFDKWFADVKQKAKVVKY